MRYRLQSLSSSRFRRMAKTGRVMTTTPFNWSVLRKGSGRQETRFSYVTPILEATSPLRSKKGLTARTAPAAQFKVISRLLFLAQEVTRPHLVSGRRKMERFSAMRWRRTPLSRATPSRVQDRKQTHHLIHRRMKTFEMAQAALGLLTQQTVCLTILEERGPLELPSYFS